MRMFKAVLAVFAGIAIVACGGESAPTTCGAGTHNDGSDVCVVDAAILLVNASNTYWKCGGSLALQFTSSTTTSGTGFYDPRAGSGSSTPTSITWTEDSKGIYLVNPASNNLAPFLTINSIVFTNPSNTSFTGTFVQEGGSPNDCDLMSGTIPP